MSLIIKLNKVNLTSAPDFFSLKQMSDAKDALILEFEKFGDAVSIKNFKTKRRENAAGAKTKTVREAIIDIWEVVDRTLGGKLNVSFVIADPNRGKSIARENWRCLGIIYADHNNITD